MEAAPDVAGGVIPSVVTITTFVQNVFGCTVKKLSGGAYDVTLSHPIDIARRRVWVQNLGALIPWCAVVANVSPTHFQINTYRINFDPTPPGDLALQLADYPFSFGVSEVPQ